ncbi:MAG: hypothetical protein JWQ66_2414 [Mucilaginibacter sp.]|nr:hypothetical protein [Mucilaginibacter sp.]
MRRNDFLKKILLKRRLELLQILIKPSPGYPIIFKQRVFLFL